MVKMVKERQDGCGPGPDAGPTFLEPQPPPSANIELGAAEGATSMKPGGR